MTNTVIISTSFKRNAKRLVKKYHTLQSAIDNLIAQLEINPYIGKSYGSNLYKIRVSDERKGKGKRGGFRVMYFKLLKQKTIQRLC